MNRTTARLGRLAGALLAAGGLVLAGCTDAPSGPAGDGGSAGAGTASGVPAQADVDFASGMIPHHEQALEMAAMAGERAEDPRVRDLASRIEDAQDPEIDMMSGWLDEWSAGGHMDAGHGSGHGEGMMSTDDMDALMSATGEEFDRLFLEQMIEHHAGAVAMAERQIAEGRDAEAVALAEAVRDAQTAEIAEMERLLADLAR